MIAERHLLAPAFDAVPPTPVSRLPDGNEPESLSDGERLVLSVLGSAGKRMTGPQLKNRLEEIGEIHGSSTVDGWLKSLIKRGIVSNGADLRGKGYGTVDMAVESPRRDQPSTIGTVQNPSRLALLSLYDALDLINHARQAAPVVSVVLCCADGSRVIVPADPLAAEVKTVRHEKGVRQIVKDIIAVLEDAGHRLTTQQVIGALAAAGKQHGDSTVIRCLADLCKGPRNLLTNRHDSRGKGYGLPGWSIPSEAA
jgi:hypothetical protein